MQANMNGLQMCGRNELLVSPISLSLAKICSNIRELSFLKLGTGVEEFLEGYQIFWPRFIGVSNILEKIVKYLMGCKVF